MKESKSQSKQVEKKNAEKPLSLAPLSTTEALRGLLQVKPMKSEEIAKASKKRTGREVSKDSRGGQNKP